MPSKGGNWAGWATYEQPQRAQGVEAAPGQTRRAKYAAVPHWVLKTLQVMPVPKGADAPPDGALRFASGREAKRFVELSIEQARSLIRDLLVQPQFALHVVSPAGVKVCVGRYIADFSYIRKGRSVVEDAKGMRTAVYRWKKAHVEAEYGIRVQEV